MARGWESKSVEDQIADAQEASRRESRKPAAPPADPAREARRQSLQLARTRALQDLQLACNAAHRALLHQTIEHLDAELGRL